MTKLTNKAHPTPPNDPLHRTKPRGKTAPLRALACAGALALVAAPSCRAPTQVTVTISTDIPCAAPPETVVRIGPLDGSLRGREPVVTTTRCKDGRVGSIVVVPSDLRDQEIGIWVATRAASGAKACDDATPTNGCIVARRALHFVEHSELDVPIEMLTDCSGVRCSDLNTTCVHGACVNAHLDAPTCHDDGCRLGVGGDAGPPDASDTGPIDAGTDTRSDAITDAISDAISDTDATPPPATQWAFTYGTRIRKFDAVGTLSDGSVVAALSFDGKISLDGTKSSAGDDDIVLVRYSAGGSVLWARQVGGDDADAPMDLAVDADDSIVLLGDSKSTTIDASGTTLGGATGAGIFLVRYSSAGAAITGRRYPGAFNDLDAKVAIGTSGEIYVLANSTAASQVAWDGTVRGSASSFNLAIGKFPASLGAPILVKTFGDTTHDAYAADLTSTPLGPVIVGHFMGSLGSLTSSIGLDGFVLALDGTLAERWAVNTVDGASPGEPTQDLEGVIVTPSGNVVAEGAVGGSSMTIAGHAFVGPGQAMVTLSPTGTFVDGRAFSDGYLVGDCWLAASPDGTSLALFGQLGGSSTASPITFDPSLGTTLTPAGGNDFFLVELDGTGRPVKQRRFGDASAQFGYAGAIDSGGNIVIVGGMNGVMDLGFTKLTATTSASADQAFIARFAP